MKISFNNEKAAICMIVISNYLANKKKQKQTHNIHKPLQYIDGAKMNIVHRIYKLFSHKTVSSLFVHFMRLFVEVVEESSCLCISKLFWGRLDVDCWLFLSWLWNCLSKGTSPFSLCVWRQFILNWMVILN